MKCYFLLINSCNWLIVVSPAAIEPIMEKPDVTRNQLRQTRGTSHDADTAKLKSRWSGRKPPNRKPPNQKLPNQKPPNQKPSNQKPSNQKLPKACHGWFEKKWVLSGQDGTMPPTTSNWRKQQGA